MKKLSILFLLCTAIHSSAQHEADTWYFGFNAGITFSTIPPTSINGPIQTAEGCASLSNSNGDLLFSSDGVTVWDRTHAIMPNGTGLNSSGTCTQAALFVPYPGQDSLYFLFTPPDQYTATSLCYSLVDLTLNNGYGDVINKNTPLFFPSTEKVTAVRHANGTDIWVIGHSFNNADFYAYLITSAGINAVPVVSTAGWVHEGPSLNKIGYMKASPCGDKLALVVHDSSFVELFDFDNATGIVSNAVHLGNFTIHNAWGIYGLEFSPDGSRLYISQEDNPAMIVQYNLAAGSPAAIIASLDTIVSYSGWEKFSAMQLGPDGKIYVGRLTDMYLAVIDSPDSLGSACNFIYSAIPLIGFGGSHGLPNFMSSYFCSQQAAPVAGFTSSNNSLCPGDCINFSDLSANNPTAWQWFFPGADSAGSVQQNPSSICYPNPGSYDVILIASNASGTDTLTLTNFITVNQYPPPQGIQQSGDTLFANAGSASYQWYYNGSMISGATDYYYVAPASGDYNVVVTDTNGCEVEAVIFSVVASAQAAVSSGSKKELIIFPNPVVSELKIKNEELKIQTTPVSIYNVLSKMVFTAFPEPNAHHDATIDVSSLSPGMYYLELRAGEKILRGTFLKAGDF
jgi:hypothetical protein